MNTPDREGRGRHPADQPAMNGANAGRQAAMALLARATLDELQHGLAAAGCSTLCDDLRKPEVGLVMARGRISGTGQPFNLGEISVTRAAVRLADGTTGSAYLMGRDPDRAKLAAIADAHWQRHDIREQIETHVLEPVRQRLERVRHRRRAEVAATQVDFFTMVRGDD